MKISQIAQAVSLACLSMQVAAQQTTPPAAPQQLERVEVTGSSIRRVDKEGQTPVQIITREELDRAGVVTVEQLLQRLSTNGNGANNLASNSDVGAGSGRGNNGLSAANLRGQGDNATLILLNGRRVASHGLNGGVVDLNSIPFAAIQRVEVLKDGASAVYGADAVGGVINFILRKDFTGITAAASADITQQGGGNIARASATFGFGGLDTNGFNIMGSVASTRNQLLRGDQRDFVNTFQPDRGLSVDTRGTPFATAVAVSSIRNILSSRATPTSAITNSRGPTLPGGGTQTYGSINVLDLPGQAGCKSIDGQDAYDELIWDFASARFACAWDTGRAAALQQPVVNNNGLLRGTVKINQNLQIIGEFVGAQVTSKKIFSNNQLSTSNSTSSPLYRLLYPSTGAAYTGVFNAIAAAFPSIEENRGQGISFRWRCIVCGPRQIETTSNTARTLLAIEGSAGGWDYRAGVSTATSDVKSKLAGGYYFNDKFFPSLRDGTLNPFLQNGQQQTAAATAAVAAASATGTTLYGGKNSLSQFDASASGPIFKLGGGDVMLAVGVDRRTEKFNFNGNASDVATQANIFNAPIDSVNQSDGAKRTITAVYTEVLAPVTDQLELTAAVRHDRYSGFGGTTNPKFSFKFVPAKEVAFRGSYNTAFRVPTFKQIGFGITEESYSGKDLYNPFTCASQQVSDTVAGCASITPNILTGGNPALKPENTKQATLGIIVSPTPSFSVSVDYWYIRRVGAIQDFSLTDLLKNYTLFPNVFIRDGSGNIAFIDQREINAGEQVTKGLEIGAKFNTRVGGGRLDATIDGTYLIGKKARPLANQPFGSSQVGEYGVGTDLALRWKHLATVSYSQGVWAGQVSQQYTSSYNDNIAPGVANGTVTPINFSRRVHSYVTYDTSVSYTGIKRLNLIFGIKNVFNRAPPFSATYDSDTGAGSSWDPRVADPRGRSFTISGIFTF